MTNVISIGKGGTPILEVVTTTSRRPRGHDAMAFPTIRMKKNADRADEGYALDGNGEPMPIGGIADSDPVWLMLTCHDNANDAAMWNMALAMGDGLHVLMWKRLDTIAAAQGTYTLHSARPPSNAAPHLVIRRGSYGAFMACHSPHGPVVAEDAANLLRNAIVTTGAHPYYHFHRCDDAPVEGSVIRERLYSGDPEPLRSYLDARLTGMRADGTSVSIVTSRLIGPIDPSVQSNVWCGVAEVSTIDGPGPRRTAVMCIMRGGFSKESGHSFGYTDLWEDRGGGASRYPVDFMAMLDPPATDQARAWRSRVTTHIREGFYSVS